MANYQAAAAQASQARATAHLPSANPQCDFVCQPYRLPMADVALGLSEVAVYTVFWRWRQAGIWERIHDALRRKVRRRHGKKAVPSVAIIDSQSVRTAEGGEERGYDGGKKITGRKRHIAVDTLGLVMAVVVHAASWQDHDGACFVFQRLRAFGRLRVIFADSAYKRNGLPDWVRATFGWVLQAVLRPVAVRGFVLLPKRWIVERTFAWLTQYRRHSKDYEPNPETSEAMIHISMIALKSRRLARGKEI